MQALEHLIKAKQGNKLAHAYIIDNVISDKTLFEKIKHHLEILPQDSLYIEPLNASITIDQIRQVLDRISKTPAGKMFLVGIYPAERMNIQATNALLKYLEEPPGHTCFILLTKNHRHLLPTIHSRSQLLRSTENLLSQYETHPEYQLIKTLYGFNPGLIDENLIALQLYHAMHSKDPFSSVQKIEGDSSLIIHLTLQLVSSLLIKNDVKGFELYDEILSLSRSYHSLQNLNHQGVLDRVGLLLSRSRLHGLG